MGLRFRFEDWLSELNAIKRLSGGFLTQQSLHTTLPAFLASLERVQAGRTPSPAVLQIPKETPVTTEISHGEHEKRGKGIPVSAEVSAIWEIEPVARRGGVKEFEVVGKASNRVAFVRHDDAAPGDAGSVRFEVADAKSPGCYFHTQVLGIAPDGPFPSAFSVPRMPSLLVTPAEAIAFAIGELFQTRWPETLRKNSGTVARLAGPQRHRLNRLLEWKGRHVMDAPTPWVALKQEHPPADLFTR